MWSSSGTPMERDSAEMVTPTGVARIPPGREEGACCGCPLGGGRHNLSQHAS